MRRFDLKGLCQLLNSLVTDKDSQGHWGQGRDRLSRMEDTKEGHMAVTTSGRPRQANWHL